MPIILHPPDQMYASLTDDPGIACQCPPCRNARAILPFPLVYDKDGFDQYGTDDDGCDRDGNGHQERHGRPGYQSTDASDADLGELWSAFPGYRSRTFGTLQDAFLAHLRDIFRDPGDADEVRFCAGCGDPAWDDDTSRAGNGQDLCESCYNELPECVSCNERYPDDNLYSTLGGSEICYSCRENYCSYCEDCEGYYWHDDAGDHDHDSSDDGGCCYSPQLAFTIRNDGEEPLANDTRVTVTLPAGMISAEGLKAISRYLRERSYTGTDENEGNPAYYDLSYGLETIGTQWQAKDGNYAKRLSRHAYKKYQLKLTPDDLSKVGTIARDHSTAVSTEIEVSRELNQSASDWYNEGSCWWDSYSESRCALKTNGGFGLRSFNDGRWSSVSGRAWVLPLRKDERGHLHPTFETMTPDAFVVFNGYGDLSGYAAPRILAHMAGWTYRKIGFRAEPMYVNAGGYLVAPEDIAKDYTDGSLDLDISQHSNLYYTETQKELVHA